MAGFDPITAALDVGGKLIDRLWPDPAQRDAAKLEMLRMQQSGELAKLAADTDLAKAQIAVNQAEAANQSLFVSGWRPAIGWVGAAALCYTYIVAPATVFGAQMYGIVPPKLPVLDSNLYELVIGLLGLGAARSWEKVKVAQANS
jgi:hypothetical protein